VIRYLVQILLRKGALIAYNPVAYVHLNVDPFPEKY
jgi:hypothetical protein